MKKKPSAKAKQISDANELNRLQKIASRLPGVVYQYLLRPDGSSCFPFASEAIREIYRVTPDEVREDASKVFANIHPDDYAGVVASIQASAQALSLWQHEYRVKFDDGTIRSLLGNAVPQPEEDGSVLWHGFITDITERKLLEEEINNERTLFRTIIDLIPDAIYVKDIEGRKILANPKEVHFAGKNSEDEIIGKTDADLYPEDQAGSALREDQFVLGTGNPILDIDGKLTDRDGKLHWLLASKTPLRNAHGTIAGIVGITHDNTYRKNAENEKTRQLGLINSLLDSIPDIIFFKDPEGVYLGCNPTFAAFAGRSKNEIIGKTDYDLFDKEIADCFRQYDVEMLKQKLPRQNEEWITYPDGKKMLIDTLKTPYWGDDGDLIGILGISRDITERKQTEIKLRESESRFNQLAEYNRVITWEVDADGFYTYIGDTCMTVLGYNPEEITGKMHFYDLHPEEGREDFKAVAFEVFERKESFRNLENAVTSKNGKVILVSTNGIPILDVNGKLTGYRGTDTDITERKQAEGELSESRERYRGLSEASFEAIFFSEKGLCIEQNQAAEKMFGYTTEEAIVRYGTEWIAPEYREMVMKKMLTGDENPYEAVALKKDGTTFPCVLRGKMMHYKGRNVRVTSLTDITERKRAEEEVKRVSTRLALATRAGGVGVWEYDIVNNILVWDDQMFALYGVAKENFSGAYEAWLAGVHRDDMERCDAENGMAIRGEKEFDTEFRVCWPDGSVHNIRALATVLQDTSGNPQRMVGTNWDISEQKKTEAVLIKAMEDAETANKTKSLFLASMSHEIRTPLNSIIGFSQLMNRDQQLSDLQKEYNAIIIRAGEHLLSLINDILELSKAEAGRLELTPINADLHAFYTDIRSMFTEPARSKHLQLIFETPDDLPRYVLVDESKLRRVFINLIGNAIKFTDDGDIVVRTRFDQVKKDSGRLIVEIQDSGPGIPESDLGKLFKRFEQTSSGINKSSGTGLGLVLSRELVILMKGNITVTSKVGKGSVFTFDVEIETGKTETSVDWNTKRVNRIEIGQEAYRILVVDDNEINLKLSVKLLKLLGFETQEAVDGIDAIVKFEQWNPHLILMDMHMPVMDGYEATRLIKSTENGKNTPIIALTASLFEDDRKKILDFGLDGCILKPFRENELLGEIGKLLDIKYIYEESKAPFVQEQYLNNDEAIVEAVAKLPIALILQMKDAVAGANVDLLIKLIDRIVPENSELAKSLMILANNYDYDYLQKILTQKEIT